MEHKDRIRSKIVPIGLNSSTPDNVVEDGSLEICDNLRFANGAWRNIASFTEEELPDNLLEKELLYIHPTEFAKVYITKKETSTSTQRVSFYALQSQADGVNSPQYFYTKLPFNQLNEGASLYNKVVGIHHTSYLKIGKVVDIRNNELSYIPLGLNEVKLPYYVLYSTSARYTKLGKAYRDTFYFLSDTINEAVGNNAVFVKRADKFVYFGKVLSVGANAKSCIIKEYSTDIEVSMYWETINSDVNKFNKQICHPNADGSYSYVYYDSLDEGCLCYDASFESFGYMSNVCKSTDTESPKYKYVNETQTFLYYNSEGDEVEFTRIEGELYDAYINRYYAEIKEDNWIVGYDISYSISYLQGEAAEGGGSCVSAYSWEFEDAAPMPTISNIFPDPKKNVLVSTEATNYALEVWDEEGYPLGEIGSYDQDFTVSHFGNMLIVTEASTHKTYFYLFSEGRYQVYGNQGGIKLSFDISVEDRIHSPKMYGVPIFYKAPGVSAENGTLGGRMFLGAGERILDINKSNFDAINTASNVHLIDSTNGYFRGEFAIFLVARAKDGTEIYRTAPQIVRSETVLGQSANVFLFTPYSEAIKKGYDAAYENILEQGGSPTPSDKRVYDYETIPYTYLVWGYKLWDKLRGTAKGNPYSKWEGWVNGTKKRKRELQAFLDSHTAGDLYKLKLDISAEGDNIQEIVVYSTRLYPLFTIEKDTISTNTVDLLNEPFYEMKVLNPGERELVITYNEFKNIEAKTAKVYQATQSAEESFFATHSVEYNNCYHAYGIQLMKPNIPSNNLIGSEVGTTNYIATSRLSNNSTVYAPYEVDEVIDAKFDYFAEKQGYCLAFNNKVNNVLFGTKNEDGSMSVVCNLKADYSADIDSSYITNKNKDTFDSDDAGMVQPRVDWTKSSYTEFIDVIKKASRSMVKYNNILLTPDDTATDDVELKPSYPISVGNRVQVSDYGNPLTNPYDRSYRIGTSRNEIIAMNSAVLKLSDAKFGEFPMYVFTKEGIFAMQTGQESMYVSIIPISKDVIINPNTLGLSNAVLFFTEKGLHSLSNEGIKLLSAGLHDKGNRIPDWMRNCRLVHLPEFNEVMCVLMDGDKTSGEAYCFSLENHCWYHREIPIGEVFNDSIVHNQQTLHDIANEGNSIVPNAVMKTRPIKLDAGKELKRLETLIVRFESEEAQDIEVEIHGSVDGVKWFSEPLRKATAKTNTDVLIRRTPCSVKYLKFVVKCSNLSSNIRITGFDTEHYVRFTRRLR